jgi:hypothetical protein
MSFTPIDIDLDIAIDAATAFEIFGGSTPSVVGEIIDASYSIPVNALYDLSGGCALIEFWEPLSNPNSLVCQLANSSTPGADFTNGYKKIASRLVKQIEKVLVDSFDCSSAAPFDEEKYANTVDYTTQPHFGRVALASLAHSIFNHIDATGAISNDKQFMASMLSILDASNATTVDTASAADRYSAFLAKLATYGASNPLGDASGAIHTWDASGTAADAKLAIGLTRALMMKGMDESGTLVQRDLTDGSNVGFCNILTQIIGQNSQRLEGQDNNARVPEVHQLLPFIAGDKIYFNIQVKEPVVTIAGGGGNATLNNQYTAVTYKLKVTLGEYDAEIDA